LKVEWGEKIENPQKEICQEMVAFGFAQFPEKFVLL
jgi:hypothetical protein